MKNILDSILIYDGVCNLCNQLFLFIDKNNKHSKIFMAPYQSQTGKEVIRYFWIEKETPDSLVYIKNEVIHLKSDAVIEILYDMGGKWRIVSFIIMLFPVFMRDWTYDKIAKNRYRLFGRSQSCSFQNM